MACPYSSGLQHYYETVVRADDPRINAGAAIWQTQERIIAIAAGGHHNLLLTESGTVLASGGNDRGQIDVPSGLRDVVEIAAGYVHSVALREDGTVVTWGNKTRGATETPIGLTDVVAISAGGGHTAAARKDGSVVVWGQLGYGSADPPHVLGTVVDIASGWESVFAVFEDGTVYAWGETQYGIPVIPPELVVQSIDGVSGVEPRWAAIRPDRTVVTSNFGNELKVPEGLSNVIQVSAEEVHYLALLEEGKVVGWGKSPVRHTVPFGLRSVVEVSAGNDHSLALMADGRVVAWGKNGYRQLQGPPGSTMESAGWKDDGYYLPSLMPENSATLTRGIDPYIEEYGMNTDAANTKPIADGQIRLRQEQTRRIQELSKTHETPVAPRSAGCFIATAVYGGYECPEVWVLRRWRDHRLNASLLGRNFVRFYYSVSPGMVRKYGGNRWFARLIRPVLNRLVLWLMRSGYSSRPYEDPLL